MNKKGVVIVIPLSTRPGLSEGELISLRHLEYFLADYDKFFLAPDKLEIQYDGIQVKRFDDKYFGSINAHTRLSLSKELYQRFSDYEYMLMYHTDCLVFNQNLKKWCDMGYDFIGPPWIKGPDLPWLKENTVGNTGFSLRKIESFLELLNSRINYQNLNEIIHKLLKKPSVSGLKSFVNYYIPTQNSIHKHIDVHIKNNRHDDRFIQKHAKKYKPDFRIAPLEVAIKFGFEANVKKCFQMNNEELPFGCHAWEKYDKDFWEPFILESIRDKV